MNITPRHSLKRAVVAIIGGAVLIVGILAIPYPGPGWLIVFAGLGILSTEFVWAERLLSYTKTKYDRWLSWLSSRPAYVRALFWVGTVAVVIMTIYLLNGYGILNDIFDLGLNWLVSPLFH